MRRWLEHIAWTVGFLLVAALVTSCIEQRRESAAETRRTYTEQGVSGGVPFNKDGSETISTQSQSTTKTGLDEEAVRRVVTAAVSAAMAGAIPHGFSTTEVASGTVAAAASVAAILKTLQAAMHKRNEDEAYEKLDQKGKNGSV